MLISCSLLFPSRMLRTAEYCCNYLFKYVCVNSVVVNAHKKLNMMRQVSLQFLCEYVEVNVLSQKYVAIPA